MPHIRISNLDKEKAIKFSKDLAHIVSTISETPTEYIKVFHTNYNCILNYGFKETSFPIIDIYWMPRKQEICDNVARFITDYFKTHGYSFVQITFTEFSGNLFFENGQHY